LGNSDPLLSLKKSRAANISWGRTLDRAARTANARQAADQRFLREAGGDPKRAESLRRAFYNEITIRSLEARAAKKAARAARGAADAP